MTIKIISFRWQQKARKMKFHFPFYFFFLFAFYFFFFFCYYFSVELKLKHNYVIYLCPRSKISKLKFIAIVIIIMAW